MDHAVVIRPHGPHRLKVSLSGKGDRKEEAEERGSDREDHGRIKTSEICAKKNWEAEVRRQNKEKKRGEVNERFPPGFLFRR